jgi:CheY-like chemotaxis protein
MKPPILIIDDDPDIREAIALALETRGYRVVAASDGEEGLARLRADDRPGLVLLDLMMPGMNGWDLCETIARDPLLRDVPVVVFTGNTRAANDPLPIVGFLKKPIDLETLLAVVEKNVLKR